MSSFLMQIAHCEQQQDCRRKPAHSKGTKRSQQARIIGKQGRVWRQSYRGGPVASVRALNDRIQGIALKSRVCKCGFGDERWTFVLV